MPSVVACLVLGLVVAGAGVLKLAGGAAARAALGTYGLRGTAACVVWAALGVVEIGLGVAIAAGVDAAAGAGALLMAGACVVQVGAIAAGRTGAPCACFGARGTVGRASAGRAALLAAALALLPLLPRGHVTANGRLAIGLALALVAVVVLAVIVFLLARELGRLRPPVPSPERAHEGPEVGAPTRLIAEFGDVAPGQMALAVFSSRSCGLCRALEPTVAMFGMHAGLVVQTFDDVLHADAWAAADVPGSPYAVAIGGDGIVLAKGGFTTEAQLETVLAAAAVVSPAR